MLGAIVAFICFLGLLYYRYKYQKAIIHHHEAAFIWRQLMMNVLSEQIAAHFKGSLINNRVIHLTKDNKIEILVGDEDAMVAVDMEMFNEDANLAFDDAYNKFMAKVR
jgi:hypothetical protein